MYSLVTVNQQVSLISVTVTPSTFFVALIILLIFVSFYVPKLPNFTFPRITSPRFLTAISGDKRLPSVPSPPISPISPDRQLVLRDQSLTLFRREKKDSHRDRDRDHDRLRKEPKDRYKDRDYSYRERSLHQRHRPWTIPKKGSTPLCGISRVQQARHLRRGTHLFSTANRR